MAGIGFALRRIARRDTLGSKVQGFAHGAFVACGPWLFTVLSLGGVELVGRVTADPGDLARFSVIVIYNFSFSLVLTGPLVMVMTRVVADRIHARDVSGVPGMLVGGLAVVFPLQALVAVPFYGLVADLSDLERVLAVMGFLVIGGIWLSSVFLSALKGFEAISTAFGVGMAASFGAAALLIGPYGGPGALAGFTGGLALTLFALVARILAEYPGPVLRPFAFLPAFRTYGDLAAVGFLYNAAIWIDKWVMWLSPRATSAAGGMPSDPPYDGAMFLSYLSIVPAMALFVVAVETRFFESYRRFYDALAGHATLAEIRRNHEALGRILRSNLKRLAVLQTVVCYVTILVAPGLIGLAQGGQEMVPIFRFGTLGALFHALFLFVMVVIAYFDLRRLLLSVCAAFLVLNGGFAVVSLTLDPSLHGYGYFLASLLSAALAYALAARAFARLPYMTFVANNRGLA